MDMGEDTYTVTAETTDYRTWHTTATKNGEPCPVGRRADGTALNRLTATWTGTAAGTATKADRDVEQALDFLTTEHLRAMGILA